MNKKKYKSIVSLYKSGLSAIMCLKSIIALCESPEEIATWTMKFIMDISGLTYEQIFHPKKEH